MDPTLDQFGHLWQVKHGPGSVGSWAALIQIPQIKVYSWLRIEMDFCAGSANSTVAPFWRCRLYALRHWLSDEELVNLNANSSFLAQQWALRRSALQTGHVQPPQMPDGLSGDFSTWVDMGSYEWPPRGITAPPASFESLICPPEIQVEAPPSLSEEWTNVSEYRSVGYGTKVKKNFDQKILRDYCEGIPRGRMRRLARRGGIAADDQDKHLLRVHCNDAKFVLAEAMERLRPMAMEAPKFPGPGYIRFSFPSNTFVRPTMRVQWEIMEQLLKYMYQADPGRLETLLARLQI